MAASGENEISRPYDEIRLTLFHLVAPRVTKNHVFDSQLFALNSHSGISGVWIVLLLSQGKFRVESTIIKYRNV